jgi:transposase
METFIRIGIDLAKNSFQLHALIDESGKALRRRLSRSKMLEFFARIERCSIGMEACGSAHYWARELASMGHEVRLIPPTYAKPYVKRGKNDAIDAEAICEAMSRPGMRFIPIKTEEQQATLMMHKTRELLVKQQTMTINALRSHLAEFGLVVAKGAGRVGELVREGDTLPNAARMTVEVLAKTLQQLNEAITEIELRIADAHEQSEIGQLIDGVPGVGKLIASAVVATTPDPNVFKSGRDFAAWLGLTPRQNSSGGKPSPGAITKKGNRYIRKLLVLAAGSLLYRAGSSSGVLAEWIVKLRARKPGRLVTVALANKLARIIWAMMKTGEIFRPEAFAKA